jgi:hypothetical protein
LKIKKIITGGCSFTEGETWAKSLYDLCKQNYPGVLLENTALTSQGQELIQKKISQDLIESLKEYKPEEIAVVVMWSSTERKCFYVNNPYIISTDLKNVWSDNRNPICDLKNNSNPTAAWYTCNWHDLEHPQYTTNIVKTHFSLVKDSSYAVHLSLENIIFLQNLCKVHNVKFYQMFYMDYPLEDIETYKDHELVKYLYDQFDYNSIVDKKSIFTYLKELDNEELYFRKDAHPTKEGHELWFKQVLLPYLTNKGFFND